MALHTHDRVAPAATQTDDGIAVLPETTSDRSIHNPAYQGFLILWLGFVAAPILFGLDQLFFNKLTTWEQYLAPVFRDHSPLDPRGTMMVVGAIEIVAGLLVLVRPRIGAYVVAAWLAGIIVNLLLLGDYYDIALRDFGLLIGALALARLAAVFPAGFDRTPTATPVSAGTSA